MKRFRSLLLFVLVSMACGVLSAALMMPLVVVFVFSARAAERLVDELPVDLQMGDMAARSQLVMADGSHLGWFFDLNRVPVQLNEISPHMRNAQLAIENHRFYEQGPLDVSGILRALAGQATSRDAGGGSGITQQYVKLIMVEQALLRGDRDAVNAAQERSLTRKVRELRHAMALDKRLSKDRILQGYLNLAYYGDGAYGVEAAAQHYFGVTARRLTLGQAAMLAGIVKSPTAFNPVAHPGAAHRRRDLVLQRMVSVGTATKEQADTARRERFDPRRVRRVTSGCQHTRYPFVCDAARRELLDLPHLGATAAERQRTLHRGRVKVRLTVQPSAQDGAQVALARATSPHDPVVAVTSLVEPGTGRVRAMAQSRPRMGNSPGQTWYNHAVPTSRGGAEGYQAGSTFKIFTMAAALTLGIGPGTVIASPSKLKLNGRQFTSCSGTFTFKGRHTVENLANQAFGEIDMRTAAAKSVNTYFIQLQQRTGLCEVARAADRFGIQTASGRRLASTHDEVSTLTLGPIEVAPLSVANAYATIAAGGRRCSTHFIDSITRPASPTHRTTPSCERVISADVARDLDVLLSHAMTNGAGQRALLPVQRQGGKTGTTDANQAVWFAGYTQRMAAASMIAIDKRHQWWGGRRKTLKGIRLPRSGTWLEGTGGGDAGRLLWRPAMLTAL